MPDGSAHSVTLADAITELADFVYPFGDRLVVFLHHVASPGQIVSRRHFRCADPHAADQIRHLVKHWQERKPAALGLRISVAPVVVAELREDVATTDVLQPVGPNSIPRGPERQAFRELVARVNTLINPVVS